MYAPITCRIHPHSVSFPIPNVFYASSGELANNLAGYLALFPCNLRVPRRQLCFNKGSRVYKTLSLSAKC